MLNKALSEHIGISETPQLFIDALKVQQFNPSQMEYKGFIDWLTAGKEKEGFRFYLITTPFASLTFTDFESNRAENVFEFFREGEVFQHLNINNSRSITHYTLNRPDISGSTDFVRVDAHPRLFDIRCVLESR